MRMNDLASAAATLDGSALQIDEEFCINLRGRHMACQECETICPSDAIKPNEDDVVLARDKCTGCGSCVRVCPAGALSLSGFSTTRFLDSIADQPEIHLHCRQSRGKAAGVVIPCFQTLDARILAAARGKGVQVINFHGLDLCEGCERGDAREHLPQISEELVEWLGEDEAPAFDLEPEAAEGERKHNHQPAVSRRNFLRLGGAKAVKHAADWLVVEEQPEDLLDDLPFYQDHDLRQRPVAYQQALVEQAEKIEWREGAQKPWRRRAVTEDCTGCLVCGERCPTGALRADIAESQRALAFEARYCTDCGLCERICPTQAIGALPCFSVSELLAPTRHLIVQATRPCSNCGDAFVPQDTQQTLCSICRNEQDLDEDWMAMLSG